MIELERHYTVKEVSEMWHISYHTVLRLFQDIPGVLKISAPRLLKRQAVRAPRVTIRIPESILMRVHDERSRAYAEVLPRRR